MNSPCAGLAGWGFDDLQAAIDRKLRVADVTYCNSISVSEHVAARLARGAECTRQSRAGA
jgi:lactate dehydrogenase-like 2-hydroxyacid dehydrogenase